MKSKITIIFKKQFFATLVICFSSTLLFSQGAAINTSGAVANSSAGLDIDFNDRGLLIPRLTTAERNAIQNTAEGLQIFNTDNKCFEYFAYGIWQQMHCAICPAPEAAGTISGNSSICQGDNGVNYSVPLINNANTYIWTYTGSGATINGNSETITIDFSASATSGNLTVKGTNQCGDGVVSSNFSITVNNITSSPTASTHTPYGTEIIWEWSDVSGATGYQWNTINTYPGVGINTVSNSSYLQSGLTCGAAYTLYVWAYNSCGYYSISVELNSSTLSCVSCNVGDSKEGGKVFYHDVANNKCYVSATIDQSSGAQWGCYGTSIGGTGMAIGTGQNNTTLIDNACTTTGIAADICNNLSLNSYTDWFLPSKDELNHMYIQRSTIGGFSSSYWSSSEYNSNHGCLQSFDTGLQGVGLKSISFKVRCVRRY